MCAHTILSATTLGFCPPLGSTRPRRVFAAISSCWHRRWAWVSKLQYWAHLFYLAYGQPSKTASRAEQDFLLEPFRAHSPVRSCEYPSFRARLVTIQQPDSSSPTALTAPGLPLSNNKGRISFYSESITVQTHRYRPFPQRHNSMLHHHIEICFQVTIGWKRGRGHALGSVITDACTVRPKSLASHN